MAGFILTASSTHGTVDLSSAVGTEITGEAYLSVGSLFTIQASAPAFGGCASFFNVSSITATWNSGSGQFLKKLDYVTGKTLTETIFSHSITDTPSATWSVTLSPVLPSFSKDFYLGIPTVSFGGGTSLSDTVNVTVNYDNGQQDTCSFVVHMEIPTMTMNMVWPTTASTKFDFGPFKDIHNSGGTIVYDNTRVAWNDANFVAQLPAAQVYSLGATACGQSNPIQWSGTGTNGTHVDGVFYFIQLVQTSNVETDWFDCFWLNDEYLTSPDNSSWSPSNPYILDSLTTYQGPTPYLWTWQTYTTASAGSGSVAVPGTGSFKDLNGNFLSAYADDPFTKQFDVTSITGTFNTLKLCYRMHYVASFKSYFIFHPNGGIPIAITGYTWGFNLNQDNSTVRSGSFGQLTWLNAYTVQANWTGTFTTTAPSQFSGPVYVKWDYTLDDANKKQTTSLGTPRFRFIFGSHSPNGGPMGGAGKQVANTGFPGLPRAIAGNVSTMNTVL